MAGNYTDFRSELGLKVGNGLWVFVSPVLILFGTAGNAISIMILSRPAHSKSSSTAYFLGLAIFDLLILYIGLFFRWCKSAFDWDVRFVSTVTCKLHGWLFYSLLNGSVWILVAITVERMLATLNIQKHKTVCTRLRAKLVVLAIGGSAFVLNGHILYGFELLEISNDGVSEKTCFTSDAFYADFMINTWTWVGLSTYSLIPFAVLSTGNICVVYTLVKSRIRLNTQIMPQNEGVSVSVRKRKISRLTLLQVCLNLVFIISTLPICVYLIGEPYWVPKDVPRHIQLQDPWLAIANLMMYANHACNFIMYCLAGSKFRNEVKKMFRIECWARTPLA